MLSRVGWLLWIVLGGLWLCSPGLAVAQDYVSAKVLISEGQVTIHRETTGKVRIQAVALKVDDDLRAGDTIMTGKNGRLVLGLSDGSQAVIAPKTTVIIKDLSQSPRTLFQVLKGQTRIHIEKLGGRPNPYRVNTPTAVIAVRGTIFDVVVQDDEDTQVFLHEGAVEVANLNLLTQPVFLNAGQTTRVMLQRLPSVPGVFKAGRNDNLFKLKTLPLGRDNNGRIAERGPRPDNSTGSQNGRPAPGRTGTSAEGNSRPELGRTETGKPEPNGRSAPPASTPAPAPPRTPTRKP